MAGLLEGKVAIHSFAYSRGLIDPTLLGKETEAMYPPVRQALVRANPLNGRKTVYIGSHASHIEGMPVDEGRAILKELLEIATRPEHIYQHRWRQLDLVISAQDHLYLAGPSLVNYWGPVRAARSGPAADSDAGR